MAEYILDFAKPIVELTGQPSDSVRLGKLLGQALASLPFDRLKGLAPTKLMGWVTKMVAEQTVTLDRTDFDLFRELATSCPGLSVLVLAQVETVFLDALDAVKTKA